MSYYLYLLKPFLKTVLSFRTYLADLFLEAKRFFYRLERRRVISNYLSNHECAKLVIGSGQNPLPGWLNSDLFPASRSVIFLDAKEPFPFRDNSFDYIHCEHMIEHIDFAEGKAMLRECFRVLKPAGTLRVSTPDLGVHLRLFLEPRDHNQDQFIDWVSNNWLQKQGVIKTEAAHVLNLVMHAWGHKFIYDEKTLALSLKEAGFNGWKTYLCGKSDDTNLMNIESHGSFIENIDMNAFESLTIEAYKS